MQNSRKVMIALISIIVMGAIFALWFLNQNTSSESVNADTDAPNETELKVEEVVKIEPSTEEMDNYILDKLSEFEDIEPADKSLANMQAELESIKATNQIDEIEITPANKEEQLAIARETFSKKTLESKAELLDRLSKQTGLEVAELEELFYGELEDFKPKPKPQIKVDE